MTLYLLLFEKRQNSYCTAQLSLRSLFATFTRVMNSPIPCGPHSSRNFNEYLIPHRGDTSGVGVTLQIPIIAVAKSQPSQLGRMPTHSWAFRD